MTIYTKLTLILTIITTAFCLPLFISAESYMGVNGYCAPQVKKQCVSNISYWYNSCGALESVYQNCNTAGQTCQDGQCVNPNNNTQTNTNPNQPTETNPQTIPAAPASTLVITMIAQKTSENAAWSNNLTATVNDTFSFLVTVKNTSTTAANNVKLTMSPTQAMAFSSNVSINGVASGGNIFSGITLGTLAPRQSIVVAFSGTVQNVTVQNPTSITATTSSDTAGASDSDTISMTIPTITATNTQGASSQGTTTTGTVAGTNTTNTTIASTTTTFGAGIFNFLKRWYIWIIVTIVLIALFIIIFRRLSSSV